MIYFVVVVLKIKSITREIHHKASCLYTGRDKESCFTRGVRKVEVMACHLVKWWWVYYW